MIRKFTLGMVFMFAFLTLGVLAGSISTNGDLINQAVAGPGD